MTLEILQKDMVQALKDGNKTKKEVLSNMIAAVKNAAMTPKGKVEATEKLVDGALVKYQKMVEEKIAACPSSRLTNLMEYKDELKIVKQYAPQLMTNPKEIKVELERLARTENIPINPASKNLMMKKAMSALKGKADLATVRKVLEEMYA